MLSECLVLNLSFGVNVVCSVEGGIPSCTKFTPNAQVTRAWVGPHFVFDLLLFYTVIWSAFKLRMSCRKKAML